MQYIDNDMDDLFKKAGENYPLRTDGADWDKVAGMLSDAAPVNGLSTAKKNRKYLWLLLLIPAVYWIASENRLSPPKPIEQTKANASAQRAANNKNSERNSSSNTRETPITEALPAGIAGSTAVRKKLTENNLSETTAGKPIIAASDQKIADSQASKASTISSGSRHNNETKNTSVDVQSSGDAKEKNKKTNSQSEISGTEKSPLKEDDNIPVDSVTSISQPKSKDSVLTTKADTASVKPPQKRLKQDRGFYYGALGGPDISSIKSQKSSNVGYSAGIIVGYRINTHWAVEAGALIDKKKYYTKGKYFDKAGASIPSTVDLLYLDGGCNMFEFPVSIRYDLRLKKNSLFGTAGLTSYVMRKEDYEYGAKNNGMYYEGYKSYRNSGTRPFSNLQLSAGYNYNVSQKMSLRIEPYIKMPLQKIGIGSLPVSSKGIYLGVIRKMR